MVIGCTILDWENGWERTCKMMWSTFTAQRGSTKPNHSIQEWVITQDFSWTQYSGPFRK